MNDEQAWQEITRLGAERDKYRDESLYPYQRKIKNASIISAEEQKMLDHMKTFDDKIRPLMNQVLGRHKK